MRMSLHACMVLVVLSDDVRVPILRNFWKHCSSQVGADLLNDPTRRYRHLENFGNIAWVCQFIVGGCRLVEGSHSTASTLGKFLERLQPTFFVPSIRIAQHSTNAAAIARGGEPCRRAPKSARAGSAVGGKTSGRRRRSARSVARDGGEGRI